MEVYLGLQAEDVVRFAVACLPCYLIYGDATMAFRSDQ